MVEGKLLLAGPAGGLAAVLKRHFQFQNELSGNIIKVEEGSATSLSFASSDADPDPHRPYYGRNTGTNRTEDSDTDPDPGDKNRQKSPKI